MDQTSSQQKIVKSREKGGKKTYLMERNREKNEISF